MTIGSFSRRQAVLGIGLTAAGLTSFGRYSLAFGGGGSATVVSPPQRTGVTQVATGDVVAGLKEALRVGTETVVGQLGAPGGFLNDPAVHIPLPAGLSHVKSALATVGMSDLADEVELKLNEAAEAATPKAKDIFFESIDEMTFDDANAILTGPDDSATQYFREKMSPRLKEEMRPVVETSLADVGAVQAYDAMMQQYETLPFMPDAKAELTEYGLEETLDGLFYYVAEQEKAIRTDPLAQSTELLKQVFGG